MNEGRLSQVQPSQTLEEPFHILDAKRDLCFFLLFPPPTLIIPFTQPEALGPILAWPGRGQGVGVWCLGLGHIGM